MTIKDAVMLLIDVTGGIQPGNACLQMWGLDKHCSGCCDRIQFVQKLLMGYHDSTDKNGASEEHEPAVKVIEAWLNDVTKVNK